MQEAEKALKAGQVSKAVQLYSQILAKAPNHIGARRGLSKARKAAGNLGARITRQDVKRAMSVLQRGLFEDGLRATLALVDADPTQPFFHNMLGIAHAGLGNQKGAIESYKQALRLKPDFAEARGNLGASQLLQGELDASLKNLAQATQAIPQDPKIAASYGTALRQAFRFEDALVAFNRAITSDQKYLTALAGLAATYKDLWKFREAKEAVETALPLSAQDWEMLSSLGTTFLEIGETQRAITTFEAALDLSPQEPEIMRCLGVAHGEAGNKQLAIEYLTNSIASRPEVGEAYNDLSSLTTFEQSDSMLKQMKTQFENSVGGSADRMHLGFALAKAFHDLREFDRAFFYLEAGNREKRATLKFNIKDVGHLHERIIKAKPENLPASETTVLGPKPIFIVGMNRSGTSLVEQILSSHSDVYGAGELPFVDRLAKEFFGDDFEFTPEGVIGFAKAYLDEISALSTQCNFVTDKMPVNFRWTGLLRRAFPDAPIIQMKRDARDVCLSNYRSYFVGQGNGFAYDLVEVALYHNEYEQIMSHWHQAFPGEIFVCDYEELTRSQEEVSRKILAHCGLDWQKSVLEFHKTKRSVRTASVSQVRKQMYTSSVGGWRAYEAFLSPMLATLK